MISFRNLIHKASKGIRDHIFSFEIPKKLLEVRKKAWINLFDKYSDMSDDIELNVDTLEPDEEEEVSEEESYNQRIPMRKPSSLIQYWINTGNSPYKPLADENELTETGTSLSEKEVTEVSSSSSVPKIKNNEGHKQKYKSESSYSSVDTAAYILSNANITNKADTIAIIENAKCDKYISSIKNICINNVQVALDNKIPCIENTRINCVTHNDNSNVNTNVPDNELCSMSKEYVASKTSAQSSTNIVTFGNTIQSKSCEKILSTNKSADIQSKDDIIRQFEQTSKQLTGENMDSSNQDEMLEKDTFDEKDISENVVSQESTTKDASLATLYRKKLYTGRNSPIDLILTEKHSFSVNSTLNEKHSINRLSGATISLHPALDSDSTTRKETLLVRKNKKLFFYGKKNLSSGKIKKRNRKRSFVFNKNTADINNELLNNSRIQNSIIDSSLKILPDCNNSDKQDNVLFLEPNNANIFVKTYEQNLASLNINPVVLLERITPFKRHKSKSAKNTQKHKTKKNSVSNYRSLNKSNKLYTCDVENVELDSDTSTIFIYQCKTNSQCSASKESDCSINLRLSIEDDKEDDFSISNTEEKNSQLLSLKNIDISQNKKPYTTTLEKLSQQSSVNKDCTNVKFLKEVKVMLERSSAMESRILKKNDSQNNISNKSTILSSNSYGANKMDNVKFREIKVSLERLPVLMNKNCTNTTKESEILNNSDTQQKEILNKFKTRSSNLHEKNWMDNAKLQQTKEIKIVIERVSPNTSFNDRNIILENTNSCNNKRQRRFTRNVETSAQTVKVDTKSKKYNNTSISDTLDNVAEDQIFDKTESDSLLQYKHDSKGNQDNDKYSVLSLTSSDEDDFVRLIQQPKKRLKLSKNDKLLKETNIIEKNLCNETNLATNEECYSRNLSTVTFSSKESKTKKNVESSKKRKGSNAIEKSFDNTTVSLQKYKNGKFLFSSNKSDNDSDIKNSDKRKRRASSFNYNKRVNNNNQRRSNTIMKKNEINYKNDTGVVFFQTKMFNTNSSDSEENNSYTAPIRKTIRNSFVHHNHVNFEELVNDSIAKRYNRKHSSSLNSSFENLNVTNQMHYIKNELRSTSKKAKINKQLVSKEFNDNINSKINNKRKNKKSLSLKNDTSMRDTTTQKKRFSNISLEKNNFSSSINKHISDKYKNSVARQHNDVKPTKLLMFQTKNYCDSDTNESL